MMLSSNRPIWLVLFLIFMTLLSCPKVALSTKLRGAVIEERDAIITTDEESPFGGGSKEATNIDTSHRVLRSTLNKAPRIVGGTDSGEMRNFCMMLLSNSIPTRSRDSNCGGVLVGNCHVMTAAHCREPRAVYCNALNPSRDNFGLEFHFSRVERRIDYPGFDYDAGFGDLAIVEMESCVRDINFFPPMKVANQDFSSNLQPGELLYIAGFGRLAEGGSRPDQLQIAQIPYIPFQDCLSFHGDDIMEGKICAGFNEGGVDTCGGDSGGPLFYQGMGGFDTNQTAVGVASWGIGCARPRRPGIYTDVAFFHDFIQSTVCNHWRTDQSIALCAPSTPSPIPQPQCSNLHEPCDFQRCCGISSGDLATPVPFYQGSWGVIRR